jgi:hypothetical protein
VQEESRLIQARLSKERAGVIAFFPTETMTVVSAIGEEFGRKIRGNDISETMTQHHRVHEVMKESMDSVNSSSKIKTSEGRE